MAARKKWKRFQYQPPCKNAGLNHAPRLVISANICNKSSMLYLDHFSFAPIGKAPFFVWPKSNLLWCDHPPWYEKTFSKHHEISAFISSSSKHELDKEKIIRVSTNGQIVRVRPTDFGPDSNSDQKIWVRVRSEVRQNYWSDSGGLQVRLYREKSESPIVC